MKAILKREQLDAYLKLQDISVKDLHEIVTMRYKIGIGYKAFSKLVNNNVSWKLDYALALAETFETTVENLFTWNK